MLSLQQIRKVYNAGQPNEHIAVADITLDLAPQQLTVLKGPSGSGKTTLLNIIGCLARPTSGRIWLLDREITSLPQRFRSVIRRWTFGFIFQQCNLLTGLSVLENIMVPAYPTGQAAAVIKKRALSLLQDFGLAAKASAQTQWLSGGEAQRVAIARALINDPAIIIADEPTSHLDSGLSLEFISLLLDLKARGKTLIVASHDPLVFEAAGVDRVIALRDGRIVEDRSF